MKEGVVASKIRNECLLTGLCVIDACARGKRINTSMCVITHDWVYDL